MPPMVVTVVLMLAFLAAGTLAGAGALWLGTRMARAPHGLGKLAGVAFMATACAGVFYGVLLRFIDKPELPLISVKFFIAVAAGVAISYLAIMKSFEVELRQVPIIWAPYVLALIAVCYVVRIQGAQFRESQGYYRGYEGVASLNLLDPPDAMSTPEKAISYYVQQYGKLRAANEDEGIGKILTTASHWDAKWFSDNWQFIAAKAEEGDVFGIGKVITSPHAKKGTAIATLIKPIYGKIEKVHAEGSEAVVQTNYGQIIRLHKEGRNWKVRDYLGMRQTLTAEIYEIKQKNNALTPEDEKFRQGGQKEYEEEMKALCAKAGIEYQAFDPYFFEEIEMAESQGTPAGEILAKARSGNRTGMRRPRPSVSRTGYAKLDKAEAEGDKLVDLTAEQKQTPTPTPMALAQATPPQPSPTPAQQPPPAEADPAMQDPALQVDGGQPAPPGATPAAPTATPPPAPQATPALTPAVPTATPLILENVPVETLWTSYFSAARKIMQDDPKGIEEFHRVISADDVAWLQTNYQMLSDIMTSGAVYASPNEMKLSVLKAILRNMPRAPGAKAPSVKRKPGQGIAVAEIWDESGQSAVKYTTAIVQEGGRWVIAHFCFARDFIWTPQLAQYKYARRLPLGYEEQTFLSSGFAPFQLQVQTIFQNSGYGG